MQQFVTSVRFVGIGGLPPQGPVKALETLIKDEGGSIDRIYPILGNTNADLVVVADFPTTRACWKAWLAIDTMYGWQTATHPVLPLSEFEQVYKEIAGKGSPAETTRT